MNGGNARRIGRVCCAGVVNQAIVINVTALLFLPFARLYGFTYVQLGLLTAVGFLAQMCADLTLMLLIDRVPARTLALIASAVSCAGLVFYGCVPYLFQGGEYGGIAAATAIFAFAGGMLEVVLSNVADGLPSGGIVSICLLHTVYAWAQVALSFALLGYIALFGEQNWNFLILVLALVPAGVFASLLNTEMPARECRERVRASFRPFYLFALLAVFFGYGSEVVMNQWISVFAESVFGFESAGSIGCALFALCLGAGGAVYVFVLQKRNRFPFRALIGAALAAFAAYTLAALLPSDGAALACAVLCGFFVGMLSPGAMTAASGFLPLAGGWMLASLAVSQDIAAAALPSLAGAVAGEASMRTSFLFMAPAPLLAALFLCLMAFTREKKGKKLALDGKNCRMKRKLL